MNKEISKAYNHEEFEDQIYKNWEESGYFKPEYRIQNTDNSKTQAFSYDRKVDGDPFVIMMPPPNVTGKLHIGHSLVLTLEDIMARYHRLKGEPTLWLPGMDHAGIATQTVVDKALRKKGINKNEIGREEFVKKVWEWKEEYGGIILKQTRKMGASCDWSRERFTLDDGLSVAVRKAFVELYDKGLIYRDKYIVNWCPHCHTAIADDEVEHEAKQAKLYYFKYDKSFPITIATTRPETKFGDTGVAVNPEDKRYKEFIGKEFDINLDGVKRKIRVFGDRAVDKEFGTGAVGVTPAHSAIDWKMAEANKLPVIQVIDEYGRMTDEAGEKYKGFKAKEAGLELVQYLKENDLLEKEEDYCNNLSICYRCKSAIEPQPSLQWFVKMRPLAEKAVKAVKSGEIKIIPKRFEKSYFHWMENIPDWCVSRQLWWGHRLPVYYRKQEAISNSKFSISNQSSNGQMPKTWNLKTYGEDVFDAIKIGKKSVETRAGKPEGSEKYWGDFNVGDHIIFTLADSRTDQPLMPLQTTEKIITKNTKFNNIDQLLGKKDIKKISVNGNEDSYREWWKSIPELESRIKKYGIWAIELKQFNNLTTCLPVGKVQQSIDDIYIGVEPPKDLENWVQDEDVLDTWFSSALWPFSTLGWPSKTPDFDYFYPTSVMETAYDILPFWVNRMIMMGLELTSQIPFKTVYLHGMVRDEQNRKMSKSLGNALDPLDIIPKYGTDALRMALVVGSTPGQDMAIGEPKIKGYRNFSNKIWNASRFVILRVTNGDLQTGKIGKDKIDNLNIDQKVLTKSDKEILRHHTEVIKSVTKKLDQFKFSQAGEEMYEFFWHQFCDNYIEQAKEQVGPIILNESEESVATDPSAAPQDDKIIALNTKKILIKVLLESLVMVHPFIPFVTEAVWQELRKIYPKISKSIMISNWPE